jgi:hypothetical protein
LTVNISNFDGTFLNLHTALLYRFNRNIATGLGYRLFDTRVTSTKSGDTGRFKFNNDGAELFVRASF